MAVEEIVKRDTGIDETIPLLQPSSELAAIEDIYRDIGEHFAVVAPSKIFGRDPKFDSPSQRAKFYLRCFFLGIAPSLAGNIPYYDGAEQGAAILYNLLWKFGDAVGEWILKYPAAIICVSVNIFESLVCAAEKLLGNSAARDRLRHNPYEDFWLKWSRRLLATLFAGGLSLAYAAIALNLNDFNSLWFILNLVVVAGTFISLVFVFHYGVNQLLTPSLPIFHRVAVDKLAERWQAFLNQDKELVLDKLNLLDINPRGNRHAQFGRNFLRQLINLLNEVKTNPSNVTSKNRDFINFIGKIISTISAGGYLYSAALIPATVLKIIKSLDKGNTINLSPQGMWVLYIWGAYMVSLSAPSLFGLAWRTANTVIPNIGKDNKTIADHLNPTFSRNMNRANYGFAGGSGFANFAYNYILTSALLSLITSNQILIQCFAIFVGLLGLIPGAPVTNFYFLNEAKNRGVVLSSVARGNRTAYKLETCEQAVGLLGEMSSDKFSAVLDDQLKERETRSKWENILGDKNEDCIQSHEQYKKGLARQIAERNARDKRRENGSATSLHSSGVPSPVPSSASMGNV